MPAAVTCCGTFLGSKWPCLVLGFLNFENHTDEAHNPVSSWPNHSEAKPQVTPAEQLRELLLGVKAVLTVQLDSRVYHANTPNQLHQTAEPKIMTKRSIRVWQ